MTTILEHTIEAFCLRFLEEPYLCYTEHGIHALFYQWLYDALPVDQRHTNFRGHEVCVVQKEYPTAGSLDKPRRQHWDLSLIETPPRRWADKEPPYDYLRLAAIVEFGLNEAKSHLEDDIARLTHDEANVGKAFAVHLYRLSTPGKMFSSRDWSSESKRICSVQEVKELVGDKNVTVYCGMWDATGKHKKGLWRIDTLGVSQVVQH
ncbi:MAG: hypothetical protein KDH86_16735 [Anaerolineae bacterium]|nr:hypothetical protein [Anaerolineae bacterium]